MRPRNAGRSRLGRHLVQIAEHAGHVGGNASAAGSSHFSHLVSPAKVAVQWVHVSRPRFSAGAAAVLQKKIGSPEPPASNQKNEQILLVFLCAM